MKPSEAKLAINVVLKRKVDKLTMMYEQGLISKEEVIVRIGKLERKINRFTEYFKRVERDKIRGNE